MDDANEQLHPEPTGFLSYIEHVRRHVERRDQRSLYIDYDYGGLLQFLESAVPGSNGHQIHEANAPHRERASFFASIYYFSAGISSSLRKPPTPESLRVLDEDWKNYQSYGHVILLRGFPSPSWLAHAGHLYGIDPEFWRRHLSFLGSPVTEIYSRQLLPSGSCSILKLRITTIGASDIPDYHLYQDRRTKLYPQGDPSAVLPLQFPTRIPDEHAWSCNTLKPEELVVHLTEDDISEVESALNAFKETGLHVYYVSKDNFRLPQLASKLQAACTSVTHGKGIVVLRGLDPTKRCLRDNILLFAGISSYFGTKRGVQGRVKEFIVHLRDAGNSHVPDNLRPSPFANQYQAFHTDWCDIIGMYVQSTAIKGGRSYWASAAQIYNDIAAQRPHLIKIMSDATWPFQSSLEGNSARLRPILFSSKATEQPYFCYSRSNLTGTAIVPRQQHTAQLNNEQADALDEIHFAAERSAITFQHQQGDMYFLNNLRVLHGREAFHDDNSTSNDINSSSDNESGGSPGHSTSSDGSFDLDSNTKDVKRERHLMRLWLRNEDYRPDEDIPEALRSRWEEVFGEDQLRQGNWAFNRVHSKTSIIASVNDELASFQ